MSKELQAKGVEWLEHWGGESSGSSGESDQVSPQLMTLQWHLGLQDEVQTPEHDFVA